jgi:hypothetical protein
MSNSQPLSPEDQLNRAGGTNSLPAVINTATKTDLLNRAKAAIEAGLQSFHDAAEALATAQELHRASQAEMARAIGKSESWVSLLLRWRRSGYKDESPFGPRNKAGRLEHAKARAAAGASEPRKRRKPTVTADAGADIGSSNGGDTEALTEFKHAVDRWLCGMRYEAKCDALRYAQEKAGVWLI